MSFQIKGEIDGLRSGRNRSLFASVRRTSLAGKGRAKGSAEAEARVPRANSVRPCGGGALGPIGPMTRALGTRVRMRRAPKSTQRPSSGATGSLLRPSGTQRSVESSMELNNRTDEYVHAMNVEWDRQGFRNALSHHSAESST